MAEGDLTYEFQRYILFWKSLVGDWAVIKARQLIDFSEALVYFSLRLVINIRDQIKAHIKCLVFKRT